MPVMRPVSDHIFHVGKQCGLSLSQSWRQLEGFVTHSGEKYELSVNEIRQVKPHRAKAVAS
jgi:hypothetical protein